MFERKKEFEIDDRVEVRDAIGYIVDRNGDLYTIRMLNGELRFAKASEIKESRM